MVDGGKSYFEVAATVESKRNPNSDGWYACPCCNTFSFVEVGGYEICDQCGWEDDLVQELHPDLAGGANKLSLHQAREYYKMHGWSEPRPKLPNLPR